MPTEPAYAKWQMLALLAVAVNVMMLALALVLGFHVEATTQAMTDSARGQRVAAAAGPGLVLAIGGMLGRAQPWGRVVIVVGALAAVTAIVLYAFG